MIVRAEVLGDAEAIRQVTLSAFGQPDEADLVERLRAREPGYLGLVAVEGGEVVGHIAFSPVTLAPEPWELSALGLAPMAVRPERQREGVGSMLVRAGLGRCRERGADAVFVLGHPTYYPRFGFGATRTERFALRDDYGAPPEAFMVQELTPGCLTGHRGTVHYAPAFAG